MKAKANGYTGEVIEDEGNGWVIFEAEDGPRVRLHESSVELLAEAPAEESDEAPAPKKAKHR